MAAPLAASAEILGLICYHAAGLRAGFRPGEAPEMAMKLREIVEKYLAVAGGYAKAVALESFGLPPGETQRVFSLFDEDYHISRFLHFRNDSGPSYEINGFPQTHVSIDAEIQTIL